MTLMDIAYECIRQHINVLGGLYMCFVVYIYICQHMTIRDSVLHCVSYINALGST